MRQDFQALLVLRKLALLIPLSVLACGAGAQEVEATRDILTITHNSAEPNGTLFVSDDRTYRYLDFSARKERRGQLTDSEYQAVEGQVARLASLYVHATPDVSRCEREGDGYFVFSRYGEVCMVVSNVDDAEARGRLESLVNLFNGKASAK